MKVSFTRTAPDFKENITIHDATENIAYALIRRFLPKDQDALTPEPGEKPNFRFLTTDTADAIVLKPDPEEKQRQFARSVITEGQKKARLERFNTTAAELTTAAPTAPDTAEKKPLQAQTIERNGATLYKTEILCGSCGVESMTFSAKTNSFARCKTCGQKLKLEQMTDTLLEADKRGYAFRAHEPTLNYHEQKKLEQEMAHAAT